MTNRKRMGVLALCLGMILVLFVSSAFIAHEAGHVCFGEHCPVCQLIADSLTLFRVMGLAAFALLSMTALSREKTGLCVRGVMRLPAFHTLVSWKIRLND
ncbi:MAG: hypothetical protein IKH30_06640 [Clostridia bacterium]|nr:hypothetical protein [Clostridia bacterium]